MIRWWRWWWLAVALTAACAGSTAAQTNYPSAFDSSANLPTVSPGDVIKSQESNTQNAALFALERAIGADGTLATQTILQRLATKANTSDLTSLSPKVLNGVLNAGAYTGGDIGAKVNAAVADCTTQLGSASAYCRITVPPGVYALTTPIKISRALTQLDCQNAILAPGAGFTDAPIRLNYDTVGVQASTVTRLSVRNCHIYDASQTSMSTIVSGDTGDDGNPRMGMIVAWNVQSLDIDNVSAFGALGPGVTALNSSGTIQNVLVSTTRTPYSGGNAAGVYVSGTGYGAGVDGQPINVRGVHVDNAATYGLWAKVGAVIRDLDVATTESACVAIGGASPQGWVTVSDFTLADCAQSATSATGAIDDLPALDFLSDPLQYVTVGPGTIRRAPSDGVLFARTLSYNHLRVSQVVTECWGSAFANGNGIYLGRIADSAVVEGNTVSNPTGCAAQASGARGITIDGGATNVVIDGNTVKDGVYGIVLGNANGPNINTVVHNNTLIGTSNSPIWLDVSASAAPPADPNLGIEVSANHFMTVCTDGTSCGMILLTVADGAGLYGLAMTNNVGFMDRGSTEYGIEVSLGAYLTFEQVVYDGNLIYSTAASDHTFLFNTSEAATKFQQGLLIGNDLIGGPGDWARVQKAATGTSSLQRKAVCLNSDGTISLCDHLGAANTVIGIAVHSIGDSAFGYIQTSGVARSVGCTNSGGSGGSGAIVPGDLLIRSSSTDGRVMGSTSPGVGEVVGKALSACSAGNIDLLVTLGR